MSFQTVHFGSTRPIDPRALHVDLDEGSSPDLVAVGGMLPSLRSGSIARVELVEVLERLPIERARRLLGECRRWLAVGGELAVVARGAEQELLTLVDDSPQDHTGAQRCDEAEASLVRRVAGGSLWTRARLAFEIARAGFDAPALAAGPEGRLLARAALGASGAAHAGTAAGSTAGTTAGTNASTTTSTTANGPVANTSAPSRSAPGGSVTASADAPSGAGTHVLAAVDFADAEDVTAFLAEYGPVFAGRSDIGLALLYDPAWTDTARASSVLAAAHARALGAETLLQVALVPMPRDGAEWTALAPRVDARIGRSADPLPLASSSVPCHRSPASLAAAIGGGLAPLPGVALDRDLAQRAAALHPWFYPVELARHVVTPGIGSPCTPQYLVSRTQHRMQLMVDSVLSSVDVRGKRVLDLACNCGFWSSAWALAGAAEVFGIEGRPEHVAQARLYWSSNEFLPQGRWRFEQGDIASSADWRVIRDQEQFDVTLCAGILYHVRNYEEILLWAAQRTREVLVVDTRVQDGPEVLVEEPGDLRFNAIEATRTKVVPNRQRLLAVLAELGLDCQVLDVPFGTALGVDHDDDYAAGRRVTIVARKVRAALPSGARASAPAGERPAQRLASVS